MVEIGKKVEKVSIDKITDQELLHRMLRQTVSRGKRQRIKKRVAFLNGEHNAETPETPAKKEEAKKEAAPKKESASEKVQAMLKKREEKLKRKAEKKSSNGLTEEEKDIAKKVKNKKKEGKR